MSEQLSPDGFYRWDGSQWVPTGKIPTATGAGAAPAPAADPGPATSRTTVRERMEAVTKESHHGADVPTSKKKMAVEAFELKKYFGKQKVLDGVTFGIPEGEITMIMGPSGTGKSVFLRHVVGLMFPDSGDILVDGHSVPALPAEELLKLRQNVGMLFQDGALFSSMNLYDNVAFPLRQHTKKGEDEIEHIVMRRLTEVGLGGG